MMPRPVSPDRVRLNAPIGLGFWDPVSSSVVTDGLVVTARPRHATEPTLRAQSSRHGIQVFHRLPGLARHVMPWPIDDPGVSAPVAFTFDIVDEYGRFHPFFVEAECPVSGLFVPSCLQHSPPEGRYIPMFSSPTRPVPAGMAAVRAELRDTQSGQPAAFAMLVVEHEGRELGRSFAGADGSVLLIFAYPEPLFASPPSGERWSWPLRVTAFYTPGSRVGDIPALCDVLTQRPARLLIEGSPPMPFSDPLLEWGRELVLRTPESPYLLIEPA
jgi:hypothetical protein